MPLIALKLTDSHPLDGASLVYEIGAGERIRPRNREGEALVVGDVVSDHPVSVEVVEVVVTVVGLPLQSSPLAS